MAKSFKPLFFGRCPYCKRNVYGNSKYDILNNKCYHKKCALKVKEMKSK